MSRAGGEGRGNGRVDARPFSLALAVRSLRPLPVEPRRGNYKGDGELLAVALRLFAGSE
jgi:hypothetical protein